VSGAPGVGKTYHLQQRLSAWASRSAGPREPSSAGRTRVVRLDGSSDRFTLVAMSDWLESAINTTEPVLLIVDEFHMLPSELKEQLLQWVGPRRFIKLVMIANRYDPQDKVLCARHLCNTRRKLAPALASTRLDAGVVMGHIIHCRGSMDFVFKAKVLPAVFSVVSGRTSMDAWLGSPALHLHPHTSRVPGTLLFVTLWLQCTSMLVGDEALSLRDAEHSPALSALRHQEHDRCYGTPDVRRALVKQLARHNWSGDSVQVDLVGALLYVYSLEALHSAAGCEWGRLTAPDSGLCIGDALGRFIRCVGLDMWMPCTSRAGTWSPSPPAPSLSLLCALCLCQIRWATPV
jgi:hypothetical protein